MWQEQYIDKNADYEQAQTYNSSFYDRPIQQVQRRKQFPMFIQSLRDTIEAGGINRVVPTLQTSTSSINPKSQ
jgi:hypothetical protein